MKRRVRYRSIRGSQPVQRCAGRDPARSCPILPDSESRRHIMHADPIGLVRCRAVWVHPAWLRLETRDRGRSDAVKPGVQGVAFRAPACSGRCVPGRSVLRGHGGSRWSARGEGASEDSTNRRGRARARPASHRGSLPADSGG